MEKQKEKGEGGSNTSVEGEKTKAPFTSIDIEMVYPEGTVFDRVLKALDAMDIPSSEPAADEIGCRVCEVCLKENEHFTSHCPYLFKVPNDATLAPGYALACRDCYELGGHPGHQWPAYAVRKECAFCMWAGHWTEDCPFGDDQYSN